MTRVADDLTMSAKAIGPLAPLEDVGLEKQDVEVSHRDEVETTLTEKEQKRLIRKIDLRLLPILGCMYSISLVDRGNMSLALVAGMMKDLELSIGNRYSVLVMAFFAVYILFELPSNLVMTKFGPRIWLTVLGISFGVISIGMGFTYKWTSFLACRILLGVAEAGFLPGCTFLISVWYTRYEVGKRLAAFWMLSVLANGFAGILAYGLTKMNGTAGVAGWRWIMIIEGCISCAICIVGFFLIIDFPDKADKFLKPREKAFVVGRINADRGDAFTDEITGRKVLQHLKDWKLYCWSFLVFSAVVPGFSYNFYTPLILQNGMGFSASESQLLTAPPFVCAALLTFFSSLISDRFHVRGPVLLVHHTLTIVGMFITAYAKNNGARFFGVFLGLGMVQYCPMVVLAWQANNIKSTSKRAVASATCLIGSGIGGMVSGGAFKTSESPLYQTGIYLSLALYFVSVLVICSLEFHFWRCNKLARQGKRRIEDMDNWYYTY